MIETIYDRQHDSGFNQFYPDGVFIVPSLDPVAATIVVDLVLANGSYFPFRFLDFDPVTRDDVKLGPYKMEHVGMARAIALDTLLYELRGKLRALDEEENLIRFRRIETRYPPVSKEESSYTIYVWVGSEYALLGFGVYPTRMPGNSRLFYGEPNPLLMHIASAVLLEKLSEDPNTKKVVVVGPVSTLYRIPERFQSIKEVSEA